MIAFKLADRFGWTPEQVGELTPAQVEMLAHEGETPKPPARPQSELNAEFVAFRRSRGLPYDPALDADYLRHSPPPEPEAP